MEKKHFPEMIICERVFLKKHTLELAETMFSYVDRDRSRLREFLTWVDSTKSVQDSIDYIKSSQEQWGKFEIYAYGVFDKANSTYLGNIDVHHIAWPHARCEIGYWILGDFEGKGFVSDAVSGLEKTCFELGFNRVEIRCDPKNIRSASVPRRLGYHLDGILKQDQIVSGIVRDSMVFGKTKSQSKSKLKSGQLHHIEIYVSDLVKSQEFWGWFLVSLGYSKLQKWDKGISWKLGETYLVFVQVEERFKDVPYHRCRVGLNHLAFHGKSKEHLVKLKTELENRGIHILYGDKNSQTANKNSTLFFEDPDRIKVEVVVPS